MFAPFVYWAQSENQITLKVDLTDVKNADVKLEDGKLIFLAHGQGARGANDYGFSIDLHSSIDKEKSLYKIMDRQVDFVLRKKCASWWPRLTSQPQKPPWLKIDFDRWKSEDMDDLDDSKRNIRQDYPDMYDKLHKEEFGYEKEDFKKVYLILYNLCQFVGFIYIIIVMGLRYSRDGPASLTDTYKMVGNAMKFIQLLQFLEVLHPLFGYTKGGVLMPLIQISGRAFILFTMIEGEARMQNKPVIFYLFCVWSMVEVVRYPYYITQLIKIDIPMLTWLRYTVWIPLYPLGFLCESIVVLRNIPYFEETQKYTVSLPNEWNFAFHFPSFMRIYILILCLPGMYTMMCHMRKMRIKKLGKKSIKKE